MIPHPELMAATFLRRVNRFRALVSSDDRDLATHVPNSGRLAELLVPGNRCYVHCIRPPVKRKTAATLRLVEHTGVLVSVDAALSGPVFADAWLRGMLGEAFQGYSELVREVRRGASRLDFLLRSTTGSRLWIEVKSVTLVGGPAAGENDGVARFPDAPSSRARRHLLELASAASAGDSAAIVFVVQRPDARSFAPNAAADPEFTYLLRRVVEAGVCAKAFRCSVSLTGIELSDEIPVRLQEQSGR